MDVSRCTNHGLVQLDDDVTRLKPRFGRRTVGRNLDDPDARRRGQTVLPRDPNVEVTWLASDSKIRTLDLSIFDQQTRNTGRAVLTGIAKQMP